MFYKLLYTKYSLYLLVSSLILCGCGDNNDSGNNASHESNKTAYSSSESNNSICQDGEIVSDGQIIYICYNGQWIVKPEQSNAVCVNGEIITDGTFNYTCINGQWVINESFVEQPPSSSSSSSKPIVKTKSSSSIKTKSSSSTKAKSSSSSSAECKDNDGRYIFVQDTFTTSTYKELKRTKIWDSCQNGKWKYPSNICDLAVAGQPVPSEIRTINGIVYHVWCNDALYFDLACQNIGAIDTVIINGKLTFRKCVLDGQWATIISTQSSSSISNTSSSSTSNKSSSSYQFQDCRNKNISYGTLKDTRDGHIYKTVVIGTQTWMAENLNYVPPFDPLFRDEGKFGESIGCYDRDPKNCEKYGRFYNGSSVIDSFNLVQITSLPCPSTLYSECTALAKYLESNEHYQGICPSGWHIPTDKEVITLRNFVSDVADDMYLVAGDAGKALKATCNWRYVSKSVKGTDDYGFYFLPDHDNGESAGLWYLYKFNLWWLRMSAHHIGFDDRTTGVNRYLRCIKD